MESLPATNFAFSHEMKKKAKKLTFDSNELKRFYYDLVFIEELSLSEIEGLRRRGEHLQPDLKTYYYLSREDEIKDYFERYGKYLKFLEKEGISHDVINNPRFRAVNP